MTLKSWEKEFMPFLKSRTWLEALKKTLKKTVGLRKKNLAKHKVTKIAARITDHTTNWISVTGYNTCPLCIRAGYKMYFSQAECHLCPIGKESNRINACTDELRELIFEDDPEPAIKLLRRLIAKANRKKQNK